MAQLFCNDCVLSANYATNGGALYQSGGEVSFADCTLTDNVAAQNGAIAYSATAPQRASTGAHSSALHTTATTCVLYSEDTESEFLFYYHLGIRTRSSLRGVPSAGVQFERFHSAVVIARGHRHDVSVAQHPRVLPYDCSGGAEGVGGISCTCTVDEQPLDPELLDDRVGGCDNSALLTMPETDFTLAVTKQRDRARSESPLETLVTSLWTGMSPTLVKTAARTRSGQSHQPAVPSSAATSGPSKSVCRRGICPLARSRMKSSCCSSRIAIVMPYASYPSVRLSQRKPSLRKVSFASRALSSNSRPRTRCILQSRQSTPRMSSFWTLRIWPILPR